MDKDKENIQLLDDEDLDKVTGGIWIFEASEAKTKDNNRSRDFLFFFFKKEVSPYLKQFQSQIG